MNRTDKVEQDAWSQMLFLCCSITYQPIMQENCQLREAHTQARTRRCYGSGWKWSTHMPLVKSSYLPHPIINILRQVTVSVLYYTAVSVLKSSVCCKILNWVGLLHWWSRGHMASASFPSGIKLYAFNSMVKCCLPVQFLLFSVTLLFSLQVKLWIRTESIK